MVIWKENLYEVIDSKKWHPSAAGAFQFRKLVPTWWEDESDMRHMRDLLTRLQCCSSALRHLNCPAYLTSLNHTIVNWFKWKRFTLPDWVSKPEPSSVPISPLLCLPMCISLPLEANSHVGPTSCFGWKEKYTRLLKTVYRAYYLFILICEVLQKQTNN